jgi:DUF4097 and DUF4098 domain-containing protein YvlB
MRRFAIFVGVLAVVIGVGMMPTSQVKAGGGQSGNWSKGECRDTSDNSHGHGWFHDQARVCELRTTTLKPGERLGVETTNGGIEVIGENRGDVAVEAQVEAWAGSESEANDILHQVAIETSGDRLRDSGPRFHMGNRGYSVNYKLHVPRHLSMETKSMNGGIDIAHLEGQIRFSTTNGGVSLSDLAGDVRGETVNGGLEIALSGDHWQGAGLNAQTTNGGVELTIPEHYSAHLETGTVNGGIEVDFPITVQGEIKNHLSTELGSGGSTIHAETTNGGVQINRGSAKSASL